MNAFFQTLRFKLLTWYLFTLAFLGAFIIITIHILQYRYSIELIIALFFLLAIFGFIIIYKFTQSITILSSQIQKISSKTLDTRIQTIKGNDEIAILSHSFNGLLDRLDTAFKREKQFIADVAHEMKTPIATLKSSFEVTLQKERTNEEYKKIIKDSIKDTDRMTNTLKDILDLAWSELPNENLRSQFDLSDLVSELSEIGQKLAVKKNITVNENIMPGIMITGFKEQLGRAIINIIDNAIKYSRTKGTIMISLIREYHNALITIEDNGVGIQKDEIEHIFDRFYRGSKTKKTFGSGLGLSIAKATIGIHKGVIRVKSTLHKGTTFYIALPLI